MKNTFIGLIFLSIIWLSSCGGTLKSDSESGTTEINTSLTEQSGTPAGDEPVNNASTSAGEGQVIMLTKAMFLEKVYDYEKNPKAWTFKSKKPFCRKFLTMSKTRNGNLKATFHV